MPLSTVRAPRKRTASACTGLVLAFAVLAWCTRVSAQPHAAPVTPESCADQAVRGQKSRRDGAVLNAARFFEQCAEPGCPAVIRTDCAAFLAATRAETPSLRIDVRDSRGALVAPAEAAVEVDGATVAGGAALPVDAGLHRYRVVSPTASVTGDVASARGARTTISVIVPTRGFETVAPPSTGRPSWPPVALASLGVVASALGWVGFVAERAAAAGALRGCAPSCSARDLDARENRVAAFGLVGTAGVMMVAAGLALLLWPEASDAR